MGHLIPYRILPYAGLLLFFHVTVSPTFALIVFGSNQFSGFMDAPAGIVIACAIYAAEDDIRPNVIKPNIIADATKMLIIIVLQVIDIMLWY